jgi:hypothetical protein
MVQDRGKQEKTGGSVVFLGSAGKICSDPDSVKKNERFS